jgi:hypothetical protein
VRAYSVLRSTQGRRAILFSWKSRHAPMAGRYHARRPWYAVVSLSFWAIHVPLSLNWLPLAGPSSVAWHLHRQGRCVW